MWQILAIFGLYVIGIAALVLAILNVRKVISAVQNVYWFGWGMYQQARYGALPKQHYSLKNGQWHCTYRRVIKN